ncbi:DUF11 domain-containing protein [Pseudoxanthomonas yeongjuensis]|uniref:DUF11 domain-containing protein n=1 Tax=Pseudoxanthomonas yeongjuensis TaxID=377616 RepID=UPI001391ECEB|nr:DUF11 domain-containing protein [Pseudoxanthomonas yeongjuensis]
MRTCAWVTAFGLSLAAPGVGAQVQRSFINLGFEQPALAPNGCYIITSSADVPGWETTHSVYPRSGSCTSPTGSAGPSIELWRNLSGTGPRAGLNHAELNAHENSRIYQSVCLANGEVVNWKLSHRGRGATDVMSFNIDSVANQIVRASTTAAGVGSVVAGSCGSGDVGSAACNAPTTVASWADYSGSFVWNGSTGAHSFGFQAISGGTGNPATGNFLDEIVVILRPYVEFFPTPASTPEGQGAAGVPALRVTGVVAVAFDVEVTITGGTAIVGSDFTAPGNTFTVTIPAGDYGSGQSFPLPLSAVENAIIQDNRTATFAIVPDPTHYVVGSTTTCGGPANADITWTIIDDDVDLATTKSVSTPSPMIGTDFTYTVTYANNTARPTVTPLDAHDAIATIADALPAGVLFNSWTCQASNGASCPGGTANGNTSGSGAISGSVTLPAGNATAGGSLAYTITARLDAAPTCNAITNTSTIATPAGIVEGTSSAPGFVTPSPGGTANNAASADVTPACADLSIVKSAMPTSVVSGGKVAYTLLVSNAGPAAADGAVLIDPQPAGVDCSAGTLTCDNETGGAACPASPTVAGLQGAGLAISTFPVGGSLRFTLTCMVSASGNP